MPRAYTVGRRRGWGWDTTTQDTSTINETQFRVAVEVHAPHDEDLQGDVENVIDTASNGRDQTQSQQSQETVDSTQQEAQQIQGYTLTELQPIQRSQALGSVFGNITPVDAPSPMNLVSQMPRTPSEFNLSDFLHSEDSDKQQGSRSDIQQVPPSQQD